MSFFTSFTAVHGDITDVSAIEACYVVMGARGARNRLQGFMASVVFASGYWWRPQQYPFSCASPYLLLPELTIRKKKLYRSPPLMLHGHPVLIFSRRGVLQLYHRLLPVLIPTLQLAHS